MEYYQKIVPQSLRIKIRNIQYHFDDLIFHSRLILHRLKTPPPPTSTSKPPSICYIIPTTNITGGIVVVCEHANRLKKLGHRTLIATLDNGNNLNWFPHQSVEVVSFQKNKNLVESFDIVVATGWSTAYELLLLNAKRKVYFVQSDETRFYPPKSFLRNRVNRTYSFPFEFITEAKWIKTWLKKNFQQTATHIPNGINLDIFHPTKPLEAKPKNKKRILLEGAINLAFKGMAEAFEAVKDIDCEIWCVSYDGKPKPEWRCDRFFEKVPLQKMPKIYSSCDILLKLSKVEGFFGPPLEMMACGGVPIVSRVTGYNEYIKNNYNALVTNTDNPQLTKKLINHLITNPTLYRHLQIGGQKTAKLFNWDISVTKLSTFYGR